MVVIVRCMAGAEMHDLNTTGRGVRVALIDSGISAHHPHVGELVGGIGFQRVGDTVVQNADSTDVNGHGTACAGVVRWLAPDVGLFSIRILGPDLLADGTVLASALDWCVENEVQVINVSAGSTVPSTQALLRRPLAALEDRGVVVVAAKSDNEGSDWPADCDTVLSVSVQSRADPRRVYTSGIDSQLLASGHPRPVDGVPPSANLSGPSFAAPRVTALTALVVESHPDLTAECYRRMVMDLAEEPQS